MSSQEIPGFLKKRKLLYETKDKSLLAKHGDMFFDAGFIDDALDFYERAESREGYKKVDQFGRKEGNLYLYRKVCKITKINPDPTVINEIGTKALELGKLRFALDAFRASGNEAMVKKVEGMLGMGEATENQ